MSDSIKNTAKGGAYIFASNTINNAFGFLFIALSSRFLGPVEFGIFSLGLSVTTIIGNLGAFGLPNTIQRFLSGKGEFEKSPNIYGSIISLYLIVSLLFSFCLFISSSYISTKIFNEPGLANLLKIFAVGLTVNIGFRIFKAILQAQVHVKEILFCTIIRSISNIVFLGLIIFWIRDATAPVLATITALFFGLIYAIISVKKLPLKISLPDKESCKRVLMYSLPLVFVGFGYLLAQQTDRIMLGWLSVSADVGIYTVSSTLALVMTTLHSSLVSIFMPLASTAFRNRKMKELNETYLFISKWVGSVNGILSLIFASTGMFLLKIFGAEFSTDASYQLLIILTVFYFIGTWVGPTGALLIMADGHRVEMFNTAIYIVLNIGFNYIFILKYGLIGAAWGTLLAGVVKNILQGIEIRYMYKLNIVNSKNLQLFVIVIGGIFLGVFVDEYRYYTFVVFTTLLILFIIRNINQNEKELIKRSFEKFLNSIMN